VGVGERPDGGRPRRPRDRRRPQRPRRGHAAREGRQIGRRPRAVERGRGDPPRRGDRARVRRPRDRAHGRPAPSVADRRPGAGAAWPGAPHAIGAALRAAARRVVGDVLGRPGADGRGAPGPERTRRRRLPRVRSARPRRGLVPRVRERGDPPGPRRPHPGRRVLGAEGRVGVPRAGRAEREGGDPRDADGGGRPAAGGVRGGGSPRSDVHTRRAVHRVRPLVRGNGGGVPERFRRQRRRRGGDRRVRARRDAGARDRAREGRDLGRGGDPHRRGGERDPLPRRQGSGRHARGRQRDRRAARGVGGGSEAHPLFVRPGRAGADDGLAREQHPAARGDREGRPRPVRPAGVPRRRGTDARPDRDRPVDRLRRTGLRRAEVRGTRRGAVDRGT
jgi:hypothetical protein